MGIRHKLAKAETNNDGWFTNESVSTTGVGGRKKTLTEKSISTSMGQLITDMSWMTDSCWWKDPTKFFDSNKGIPPTPTEDSVRPHSDD